MRVARVFLLSAIALPLAAANGAASEMGDEALEDITVTAEKQVEKVEKTPLSIIVVSGDTALKRGQFQLDEVMANVAGVKVLDGEAGPTFYIRGIGTGVPANVGDPEVNLNVDGVYQSQAELSRAGLYDVNRIEVLRGPQGTLYGRNAMAGVVNIITNDPTFNFEAAGSAGFGNYGLIQNEGMINIPLGETLAVRAAFGNQSRNGYLSNGADDASIQSQRLKLLFKPSGTLSMLIAYDRTHEGGEGEGEIQVVAPPNGFPVGGAGLGDTFTSSNPWISPNPNTAVRHTNFWSTHGQLDWDFGPGVLTIISGLREESNVCLNCWRSETDQNNTFSDRQVSTEIRVASANGSPLTWLAGIYYLRASNPNHTEQLSPGADSFVNSSTNPINAQGQTAFDTTSTAGFGQATFAIRDALRATGGLRYTTDKKSETAYVSSSLDGVTTVTTGLFAADHAWQALTYTAGLEADLSAATMAYAKLSTGYKSGGFFAGAAPNSYDPEHLTSYETGIKGHTADKRLEFNADAFVYNYSDYQINYLGFINPQSSAIFGVLTANASGARIYGAELDLRYHLSLVDVLDASVNPLHTRFKTLVIGGPFGGDYTGLPLPYAPGFSANLGYQHSVHLPSGGLATGRLDSHHESGSWVTFSEANGTHQPAHTISNAYLGYDAPDRSWSVTLYIKNLENTPVLTNAQGGPAGLESADIGPPRTFGLQICASFPR